MMISKTAVGIAAAGAGICFIGYCLYFDHKRRSDPLFKQKLKERRRKMKENRKRNDVSEFPDLKDPGAMQAFFLKEVQLGEELLATGDLDGGVEHLSNAIAVCGQPQQLLQVLQQTLPPQVFQLLLQRLPAVSQKLSSAGGSLRQTMTEDDVE